VIHPISFFSKGDGQVTYTELSEEEYQAGLEIFTRESEDWELWDRYIEATHIIDLPLTLKFLYENWRCWQVIRTNNQILIDGQDLLEWWNTKKANPGINILEERGHRIASIRYIPACLITEADRQRLMARAAAGDIVEAHSGEKSGRRRLWLEDKPDYEKYIPLYDGSEEEWHEQGYCTSGWKYCKTICQRKRRYDW
jgi:hypothetical protein